jgi:hypothetical protein
MAKVVTGNVLLSKHVTRKDRVLLINPPVQETRYSWVRWNQPLDLLKLAARLRARVQCQVTLLDFMKPDAEGRVTQRRLPGARRHLAVGGHQYPMWHFGEPYRAFLDWLHARGRRPRPTQIWITSLCSYWFPSIAEMCRTVKQTLPDATVVLMGHYPRLMPEHASDVCVADLIVQKCPDLDTQQCAFDLYDSTPPPFLALRLKPRTAVREIKAAIEKGVYRFTFFEDDMCREGGEPLAEIFSKTEDLHQRIRFHVICGLNPQSITPAIAKLLADKRFAEFHFEQTDVRGNLHIKAYERARAYLAEAGLLLPNPHVAGFAWIGRLGENLEEIILRSLNVLRLVGGLILKPFSPTVGSRECQKHGRYLASIPHDKWSPHLFPFAELNGITRDEYHDLYRMAAFLNEKVRNRSFEFLDGSLGAQLLRNSLRREVWKLGPSTFRSSD